MSEGLLRSILQWHDMLQVITKPAAEGYVTLRTVEHWKGRHSFTGLTQG